MSFKTLKKLIVERKTEEFIEQANAAVDAVFTERDSEFKCSLLDWAAIHDVWEVVAFLSQKYPNLLTPPHGERSAIHYAARHGSYKSLMVLLSHPRNLEWKDHSQKTALELAVEYLHADCVRLLINNGAQLPADIEKIAYLVSPYQFILYCTPGGAFQLLTKDEIAEIETTNKLVDLKLNRHSKYKKKSYQLTISDENIENILLELIDKYLYFCNRIYKETREEKHGSSSVAIKEQVKLSRAKRASLRTIIQLIVAVSDGHEINQAELTNDLNARFELLKFIKEMQASKQRYFGGELSDDSDSDDEKVYLSELAADEESSDKKKNVYMKISAKQTTQFWLKTKMITPNNAGLKKKITTISGNIKQGLDQELQLNHLNPIVKDTLNVNLQSRGKIEYPQAKQLKEVKEIIAQINSCKPKDLPALLKKSKPIFILGTRGINYMLDRWNADARRYHRKIDERQLPQYSEAVLKTLPYDYYTGLGPNHDFHQNRDEEFSLQKEALRLNKFLQSLNDSGPCISTSVNQKGSYLFNSVGDCLQDHFSNGVDNHLDDLSTKRTKYPAYWGLHLKNSFNPGIAIGSRPYHALKYTFGLKDYYPRSMLPRYWNDGTIEYSHVGKVYLSLHSLQEVLSKSGPHNLSMQDRQARVSIGDQISPEKELSFLGFMPGDCVFHQFVAKFPSFKKEWKNIHRVKYGLDKETYEAFQHLISITLPESEERDRIINLLAEWLCAYHEVLLIEIAKEEALRRGGILAYMDRNGKLTLEPENGRIFTPGKLNMELRNEVHVMRELRLGIINHLAKYKKDNESIPEFNLIEMKHVKETMEKLAKDIRFLEKIAEKIGFKTEEEGLIATKTISAKNLKVKKSKGVIDSLISQGLYAQPLYTSHLKQITYISNPEHLYTDLEINTLLHQALDELPLDVLVCAPQHPLVQGELGENSRLLFVQQLKTIFETEQMAVMPIETSQEALNEEAYFNIIGIHWNGLVISKIDDDQFKIEIIDPAHSPEEDTDLSEIPSEQIGELGETVFKLFNLIQDAANQSNVTVEVHWLATQQQAGDLDCGAWTIDNLTQRAQGLPLRTRNDVSGNELRELHDGQYANKLAP